MSKMKLLGAAVLSVSLMLPGAAFAGWGAIAYNKATGASSESHGYGSLAAAENSALAACGAGCQIMNWEENECIALATGPGSWGEAHGYPSGESAALAAIQACGANCT
jgi:hypothetical protein